MRERVITIDGPAGCGKSTVARRVASHVDGIAFNSGLVYRAVTWFALEEGVIVAGEEPADSFSRELRRRIDAAKLELVLVEGGDVPSLRVHVNGVDPGAALASSRVTREIHWVADDGPIRRALLDLQRTLPTDRKLVAEGRDMGSIVYPDAVAKFFLTATAAERARRRTRELQRELGEDADFDRVLAEVERRDAFDRSRVVAPLIRPEGATEIDSTGRTIDQVVEAVRQALPEAWRASWT